MHGTLSENRAKRKPGNAFSRRLADAEACDPQAQIAAPRPPSGAVDGRPCKNEKNAVDPAVNRW
jgi:hypothetical protein